ncbi:MAG: hypothetical protein E5W17_02350, partial [Mesorhizobium sp.]
MHVAQKCARFWGDDMHQKRTLRHIFCAAGPILLPRAGLREHAKLSKPEKCILGPPLHDILRC